MHLDVLKLLGIIEYFNQYFVFNQIHTIVHGILWAFWGPILRIQPYRRKYTVYTKYEAAARRYTFTISLMFHFMLMGRGKCFLLRIRIRSLRETFLLYRATFPFTNEIKHIQMSLRPLKTPIGISSAFAVLCDNSSSELCGKSLFRRGVDGSFRGK